MYNNSTKLYYKSAHYCLTFAMFKYFYKTNYL